MRLYIDLESLQLIEGPGFRNPVTSLRFKRGDAAALQVTFLAGGTAPTAIGDPANLELQFGIKPRGRYDMGYLVHTADWTLPEPGAESPLYQCSPSFNTVELDSAMQVGSATGSEVAEVTLMGEITWRKGTAEPTSTRTFLVVVENDVNRGTEGVPTTAEPPYPAPQDIASPAAVAAAIQSHESAADPHPQYLRHDLVEDLPTEQREAVRMAIAAAEAPPDPGLPMVLLDGEWYPAVFQGTPDNADVIGWGIELRGTGDAILQIVAGPDWEGEPLTHVDVVIPPPNSGLSVYVAGTALVIELATDGQGMPYQEAGGPNMLNSIAWIYLGDTYPSLVVTIIGDDLESLSAGEGGPFRQLTSGEGTPGWRGRLAANTATNAAYICLTDDLSASNTGWRKLTTISELPSITRRLYLDSWESLVSLDVTLKPGTYYRVRFDNLSVIPVAVFGLGYVAMGASEISDIQRFDGAFLGDGFESGANFFFSLDGSPASAADCFAEYTFRVDTGFEWAGYSMYGDYGSGLSIELDVTITEL